MITCIFCKATTHDGATLHNWRAVQFGSERFYACPAHFPLDSAPHEQRRAACQAFLAECDNELKRRGALARS